MTRLKDNYPQADFFIPDMFDNLGASFKDDIASMEHPIFVLSKKKDMRHLEYKNGEVSITIAPSTYGLPTIFDKDVLLYCAALLMTEINAGKTPPKTLRVSCRDMLVSTNKRTDGNDYERLKQALDRLTGVMIKTNKKTNNREIIRGFGVLDSYEVIESSKVKNRMVRLEITLSDWFYNSVLGKEVLTINRDYFLLGKPMERRLYEIARKFCGESAQWKIGLAKLMEKTGSTDTLRKFRLRLKTIASDDHLPDYSLALDENDIVTFRQKTEVTQLPLLDRKQLRDIKGETIGRARDMLVGTGLDFDNVITEWSNHMQKKGNPENINGALIGFVKTKIDSVMNQPRK